MSDEFKQTYGQKAVGLSFNPGGDESVAKCKQMYADIIDMMNEIRIYQNDCIPAERARLASIAITEAQSAQMWAVKALTWKD
jgi:hypothetical protein